MSRVPTNPPPPPPPPPPPQAPCQHPRCLMYLPTLPSPPALCHHPRCLMYLPPLASPTSTLPPSSVPRVTTTPPFPHQHPVTILILDVSGTYHPLSPTSPLSPSSMYRVPTTPPLPHRHPVTILGVLCTYHPPLPSPTSTLPPSLVPRVTTNPPFPHQHPITILILDVPGTYHSLSPTSPLSPSSMYRVPTTPPLPHQHPVTILDASCTYHPSPPPPAPCHHPQCLMYLPPLPSPTGTLSPSSMSHVPTIPPPPAPCHHPQCLVYLPPPPPLPHRHPVTILDVLCTYHPSPTPLAPCHHPWCLVYQPPLPFPTGVLSPSSMSCVPTTPPLPHRHPVTILDVSCTDHPSPPPSAPCHHPRCLMYLPTLPSPPALCHHPWCLVYLPPLASPTSTLAPSSVPRVTTTPPFPHQHPVMILDVSGTYHPLSPTSTLSPSSMFRVPTTPPLPNRHPVTILNVLCTYHPPLPHQHPVTILDVSCTYHPSLPPPSPCYHPQCIVYLPPLPSPTGTLSPSSMSHVPIIPPLPHRHPVTILSVFCTYHPSPPPPSPCHHPRCLVYLPHLPSPTGTLSPSSMSYVPTTRPLPHLHPVTILAASCTYHTSPPPTAPCHHPWCLVYLPPLPSPIGTLSPSSMSHVPTTTVRPMMEFDPVKEITLSVMFTMAFPSASAITLPRSPTCLETNRTECHEYHHFSHTSYQLGNFYYT